MLTKSISGKIDKIFSARKETNKQRKKRKDKEFRDRLKDWSKVLKDDADFDYAYILIILKYKLQRTRLHIQEHNIVVRAKEICDGIKEVEDLLDRVIEDDYFRGLFQEFQKKYGKATLHREKLPSGNFVVEQHVNGKPMTARVRRGLRAVSIKAGNMRQADLDKAFALMSKRIFEWWD